MVVAENTLAPLLRLALPDCCPTAQSGECYRFRWSYIESYCGFSLQMRHLLT